MREAPYSAIITDYDTIVLERKASANDIFYVDRYHDDQRYSVKTFDSDTGFIIFIVPLKPYKRRLYSILLSSL